MQNRHRYKQKRIIKKLFKLLVLAGIVSMTIPTAMSSPVLNSIAAGQASVTQSGTLTQINQTSNQTILNWKSFNIGANEQVQFVQPVGGIALNRIDPTQGVSQIFGQLSATGKIILINQAGIYFAPGSSVNVGSIIASTSNISDANFLAGKFIFDQSSSSYSGAIINQGRIIAAEHGLVALLGNNIVNGGFIQANLGSIILASGSQFTINFSGDQLLNFTVDAEALTTGTNIDSTPLKEGVANTGTLRADGGTILVSAEAAEGIVNEAINMQGVAQAQSVAEQDGEIILSAETGFVNVAGVLDASGKMLGLSGGTVKVLGQTVNIASPTTIDVSGDVGGGEILIGGNYQGKGPEFNALNTTVQSNVNLLADAMSSGNGGKIIVWSNGVTDYAGTLSARGGAISGDGGQAEVSGKGTLTFTGYVNLSSPFGRTGNLLLDPENVTIQSNSGTNVNESLSSGTYTPNGDNAIIDVTNLVTALASSNVTVTTGSTGSQNGDITVASAISWSSGNTLTLTAANNIYLNANITATNGGLTLSAVNNSQSITSGSEGAPSSTGVTAAINVNVFTLSQGQWYQINNPLPTFSATNFQVNVPTRTSGNNSQIFSNVQFLRALSGNGTSGTPYLIQDVYGLQGIGTSATLTAADYQLAGNINASGTSSWNSGLGFAPIGFDGLGDAITYSFNGIFNGANYTISNLYINRPSTINNGLFGFTSGSPLIENLGVINANITAGGRDGILVGGFGGTAAIINNVYTTGTLNSPNNAGGLIGIGAGGYQIVNSYSSAAVIGNSTVLGGLAGDLRVSSISGGIAVIDSYSNGSVNGGSTATNVGGFAGSIEGTVVNSYSSDTVTVSSTGNSIGGFVGLLSGGTLTNVLSTGFVNAPNGINGFEGGLVGSKSSSTITNSYWDTTTSGQPASQGGTGLTDSQMMQQSSFAFTNFFVVGTDNAATILASPTTTSHVWYMAGYPHLITENSSTISTLTQLQMININLAGTYTLANNITATSTSAWNNNTGFTPIGTTANPFTGSFNGQTYDINGLTITPSSATSNIGLFGVTSSAATVQNVGLSNTSITDTGGSSVGGLVGMNQGTLTNSYVSGIINTGSTSGSGTGGLVGQNTSTGIINNSYSNSTVTGFNNVGGLVGSNAGSITYAYSQGTVTGGSLAGGLVGNNTGTINTTYSATAMTGSGTLGGLVGSGSSSNVTNSFWDMGVSGISSSTTGGTGESTAQMETQSTYTGFTFDTLTTTPVSTAGHWVIVAGNTFGYPHLAMENTLGISTIEQLQLMIRNVNTSYSLATTINAAVTSGWNSGAGFIPIGTSSTPYSATFNGQGFTISNLFINTGSSATNTGLFGYTSGATIENIGLTSANITGGTDVGGMIGQSTNNSLLTNSYVRAV